MNGNPMYEIARQRVAERQQAARQAGEARGAACRRTRGGAARDGPRRSDRRAGDP